MIDDPHLSRRTVVGGALAAGTIAVSRSARGETRVILDDASRLNPTPVMRHLVRGPEPKEQRIAAIRAALKEAIAARQPVAVGAARHSMGGQSLPRDGIAITLDSRGIEADKAANLYRADAGARRNVSHQDPVEPPTSCAEADGSPLTSGYGFATGTSVAPASCAGSTRKAPGSSGLR